MALNQTDSGTWGRGETQGSPLGCTLSWVLELDPEMLGPSGIVKRPDVGSHSGEHSLPGHSGDSM